MLGPCPSSEILSRYRAGQLSEAVRDRIAAHLRDCPLCGPVPDEPGLSSAIEEVTSFFAMDTPMMSGHPSTESSGEMVVGALSASGDPLRIGAYEIKARLGGGQFGTVYLGIHRDTGYARAIKLLKERSGFVDQDRVLKRFQREAVVLDRLNHGGVARFYEVGSYDGRYYFVMEHIDGVELKKVVATEGPLAPDRVGRLLSQLCDVLQTAHTLNPSVIHRDLKPGNLMVTGTPISGEERLKVLDFGMAKLVESELQANLEESGKRSSDASSTFGAFGGTYPYASPEQFLNERVDGRSDIYAVGIILYELLTGQRPFDIVGNVFQWARVHKDDPPPPFSSLKPAVRVTPAIEAVVMRCLEKEPSRRFQTARELATAYDSALILVRRRPGPTDSVQIPRPPPLPPAAAKAIPTPGPPSRWNLDERHAIVALAALLLTLFLIAWIINLMSRSGRGPLPALGDAVHQAILADIPTLSLDQRKYARYFSHGHLVDEGADAASLEDHREALIGAVNRLSRGNGKISPKAIDPARTIFRIDLRETGWDAQPFRAQSPDGKSTKSPVNLFDLVLLEYPYGVVPKGSADFERLKAAYLDVASLVRPIAYLRGDWFVNLSRMHPLRDDLPGSSRKSREATDESRQILAVVERYQNGLTLARALTELSGPAVAPALRKVCDRPGLGLGPLNSPGGKVDRESWEAAFPEVVRAIGLGLPVPVLDNLARSPSATPGLNVSANSKFFGEGQKVLLEIRNATNQELSLDVVGSRYGKLRWIAVSPERLGPIGSPPAKASWDFEVPERITVFGRKGNGPGGLLLLSHDDDVADRVLHPVDPRAGSGPDPFWRKQTLDITRR